MKIFHSDSPQVVSLLNSVEETFGHSIRVSTIFNDMSIKILEKTQEYISVSTLKRLWLPHIGYETVSTRTLEVLSKYCGFSNFDEFCFSLVSQGVVESELIPSVNSISSVDLKVDDVVELSWLPDRICKVRYLGDNKYVAIETKNSTMVEGDTFVCEVFIKGRPLFLNNFVHENSEPQIYSVGTGHGITSLRKINN